MWFEAKAIDLLLVDTVLSSRTLWQFMSAGRTNFICSLLELLQAPFHACPPALPCASALEGGRAWKNHFKPPHWDVPCHFNDFQVKMVMKFVFPIFILIVILRLYGRYTVRRPLRACRRHPWVKQGTSERLDQELCGIEN